MTYEVARRMVTEIDDAAVAASEIETRRKILAGQIFDVHYRASELATKLLDFYGVEFEVSDPEFHRIGVAAHYTRTSPHIPLGELEEAPNQDGLTHGFAQVYTST